MSLAHRAQQVFEGLARAGVDLTGRGEVEHGLHFTHSQDDRQAVIDPLDDVVQVRGALCRIEGHHPLDQDREDLRNSLVTQFAQRGRWFLARQFGHHLEQRMSLVGRLPAGQEV